MTAVRHSWLICRRLIKISRIIIVFILAAPLSMGLHSDQTGMKDGSCLMSDALFDATCSLRIIKVVTLDFILQTFILTVK